MVKKIEDLNYYELLEVGPTSSSQEIHKAYERIRRVYDPNSIALYSLFNAEETAAIHQRIEEAYRTLLYEDNRRRYDAKLKARHEEFPEEAPAPDRKYPPQTVQSSFSLPSENRFIGTNACEPDSGMDQPKSGESVVSQFIAEFSGSAIKMLREQRGMTLRNIADITKVGIRYLELIEEEHFEKLPVRPYTRGFLTLYAKALGCDSERMCSDYLKRFDEARSTKTK